MSVRRFDKLLIANRGEIACRIMRTAKHMGLKTVAVYSDADRSAMHVTLADEAVRIGPPPARESYLRGDAIIEAARKTDAGAIHPGYGFLSENADFVDACVAAGLVFVGPPAKTMRLMGSKSAAKALMEKSSVPIVPGYHGAAQDIETLQHEAERIGCPVLVKASAGGGGRGMRVVERANDLAEAVASAKREALSAFGDDHVLIEKYIAKPRHIEVQIFGDSHGNVVSLFERECTLQRRHQKVIEEAPSIGISPQQRADMSEGARAAARAAGYVNAGTIEFITEEDRFYFIEMNTRLQVEHPVTEMITGLDLVEWQLRVAFGEKLPLAQSDITANGHAVEARIYAEDPGKGFLPSIGTIRQWREPPTGEGIRIDTGFRAGDAVTPYYDALLAKLIVDAPDRPAALARMSDALGQFEIAGVTTNIPFLKALIAHPQVRSGAMDTGLIERELPTLMKSASALPPLELAAASAAVLLREAAEQGLTEETPSPWDRPDGWRMAGGRSRWLIFRHGMERMTTRLRFTRDGVRMDVAGSSEPLRYSPRTDGSFEVSLGGLSTVASASWNGRAFELTTSHGRHLLEWIDPFVADVREADAASRIVAPMPGTVTRVLAKPGADVARGAPLIVMEAMKMEHTLRAPADGHLKALKCAVGDFVQEGAELAEFEPVAGT